MTRAQRERLLLAHDRWVWSIVHKCRRRNWPDALLEDCHQEGMLILWRALKTYQPGWRSLASYAAQNIRNGIYDYAAHALTVLRPCTGGGVKLRLRDVLPLEEIPADISSDAATDLEAADRERAGRLWSAIGALPEPEHTIFLRALAGHTQREIGRDLGVSHERVSQLYLRARGRVLGVGGAPLVAGTKPLRRHRYIAW